MQIFFNKTLTVAFICGIVAIPQKGVNFFALFYGGAVLTAVREI